MAQTPESADTAGMNAAPADRSTAPTPAVDPLFLATPGITTYDGDIALTNASGFFFQRDDRLFLVTSRHVLIDEPSHHHPSRLAITLHLDAQNLSRCTEFSMLLYANGTAVWRQGTDGGGEIDVAALEIDRSALPEGAIVFAFTPEHLPGDFDSVPIDAALCIAGFRWAFATRCTSCRCCATRRSLHRLVCVSRAGGSFSPMRAPTAAPAGRRW